MTVKFKTNQKTKLTRPSLYSVILLNDNYTSMEFVVDILMRIFDKTDGEATNIMLDVHNKGKGIVGIYTYDIAMTKCNIVIDLAKKENFPLKAIVEEA